MQTSQSLDLYLDYLLHKDALRNLFTLYYRRDAVVGKATRCFTPTPARMGWVEVSQEDVEVMGFFDWVGVIVRCALYLREEVPRRVVTFVAKGDVDEKRLQWALDIELNEKAKQEALVYREACQSHLLEWDKRSLAEHFSLPESKVPETFEAIYALLTHEASESEGGGEEEASGKGMSDVMMPMGMQADGALEDLEEEAGPSLSEGNFGGLSTSGDDDNEEEASSNGQEESVESCEERDEGEYDENQPGDEGDGLGDLSDITEEEALSPPAETEESDSALMPGSGFSPRGVGGSGYFVKRTDRPLEEFVSLVIKSATGDQGKEKGRDKVKWATHWAGYHRRFAHAQLMLGDDVVLPPKRKKRLPPRGKGKFKLQVYLDTSASCEHHAERFFSLVTNMSPEKFEITLCSFSSGLMTHDIESKAFNYRSGGTNIRSALSHADKTEAEKEMDAIVVLTDGDFGSIRNSASITKPEKWHWVLTTRRYQGTMPEASHFYDLPRR